MKVLFVTSEAAPFAVTGGLGDVSSALPKALCAGKVACRVVLPLYSDTPAGLRENMKFVASFRVPVSWRQQYCGLFETRHDGVTYYFLDNEYYFRRPGLYGYYDDAERFAFLARAALEMLPYINFCPDVIHCNDWQTALTPVYYKLFYEGRGGYGNCKTLMTIHNIQYQGKYGMEILGDVFGIPESAKSLVEYDGCVNLLKGGIECADRVTTVSPTYASEIRDPFFSHGLHYILNDRSYKLSGIVNGIDTESYDPSHDPNLEAPYSSEDPSGKAADKSALQQQMGLSCDADVPLIGMVTRLVEHKGIDLVKYAFGRLMRQEVQLAVLGTGDWVYESFFDEMAQRYPGKFAFYKGFMSSLAHKIYAGADLFLMPSLSEPCGLAQMIALRYGTIPIVRKTGGLTDTVADCGDGQGNGFTFATYNADDMAGAIDRAITAYHQPAVWSGLVRRAMLSDHSWKRPAAQYVKLYRAMVQPEESPV